MNVPQIGGDSQNTMPIAINAGLNARAIASATIDPAGKFSIDAFKSSLNGSTLGAVKTAAMGNGQVADAIQQQGRLVSLARRIPIVKNAFGAEGEMNSLIGSLNDGTGGFFSKLIPGFGPSGPAVGIKNVELTRQLYSATTPEQIETIVANAKIADPAFAQRLIAAGKSRLASTAVESTAVAATQDASKAVIGKTAQGASQAAAEETAGRTAARLLTADDLGKLLSKVTANQLKGGHTAAPAVEDVIKALKGQEPAPALAALEKLGLTRPAARKLLEKIGPGGIQEATTATGTEVASKAGGALAEKASGLKNFFGKLLGGIKGNFIVAGVFSLASNTIQLATGKMNWKQFIGLTALDTAAYGGIGWASTAAGAAIGSALFPGVGTVVGGIIGFAAGFGLAFLGGSVYEKFIRTPVKNLLGGGEQDAANPAAAAADNKGAPTAAAAGAAAAPAGPAPLPRISNYDDAINAIDQMGSH